MYKVNTRQIIQYFILIMKPLLQHKLQCYNNVPCNRTSIKSWTGSFSKYLEVFSAGLVIGGMFHDHTIKGHAFLYFGSFTWQ